MSFDDATKHAVLGKVRQVLKPDGYLFLGSSESMLNRQSTFTRVQVGRTVYYQPGP
jgi:chemotaxis protein methyltransferase CheR